MGKSRTTGLNSSCHCGSGRKYKYCHGGKLRRERSPSTKLPLDKREHSDVEIQQFIDIFVRDPRFRIWYWVPHPDQDLTQASPLQFYTPGILRTSGIFAEIATWPGDIRELPEAPEHSLVFRLGGLLDRRVTPVEFSAFAELAPVFPMPFRCVISTPDSSEFVAESLSKMPQSIGGMLPWLHISTHQVSDAVFMGDVTRQLLRKYALDALDIYEAAVEQPAFIQAAREVLAKDPYDRSVVINQTEYGHGITAPNEIAARSFGFTFADEKELRPDRTEAYIDTAIGSATAAERSRNSLLHNRPLLPVNKYTIAVLSPAWVSRNLSIDPDKVPDAALRRTLVNVWRSLLKQETHFMQLPADETPEMLGRPEVGGMVSLRQQEAKAFVASLCVHAAHDLTPVLRLEPRVNRVRGTIADIGHCARGGGPHREFKLRKLGGRLSEEMHSLIDRRYLALLAPSSERIEGLSLVTDLPLELLPVEGVPLALKYDCSRIPLNPGNVSFGLLMDHRTIKLQLKHFADVLVVRSFSASDRLRPVLERAIRHYGEIADNYPNVRIVDVDSPAGFIHEVNSFSGAVLIFDGHGSRDTDTHTGSIVVGGEPMDLWLYRKELRLPPIVLLSACDTLPIDGSHGSTAVGMLAVGARTVLGTLMPISALTASLFAGRLLYRIAEFLPLAGRVQQGPLEWRSFLAGLLRMAHVSDLLLEAQRRYSLDERIFTSVQMDANVLINSRNPSWETKVADRMRQMLPRVALPTAGHVLNQLTDALKYVQVGSPERIHIVPDHIPVD